MQQLQHYKTYQINGMVGAKYNNLLQNVKGISPEEFTFIKEDLHTAKDSWKDVKDYTEKLHGCGKVNSGLVLLFIFHPVFCES